ncbi:MAG: hypothetical protein OEV50_03625 [Candidatus Aminicenantes bacterium]|nr:hypothetical protein [Candidatus Aminicenantes bacterium]
MSGEAMRLFSEAFSRELRYGVYPHQDMNLESLCGYPRIQELIHLKG